MAQDLSLQIKQPTEMPTSTMALLGRFLSFMGRFQTLMGRFPDFVLMGRFTSWKSTGKQPIKKRGIKRFLRFARIAWFSRIVSGSRIEPPFLRIALRGAKNYEWQVWGDSRESLAHYENRGFLCESIRVKRFAEKRPDSRCESPGHLSI